jgi:hypothetical protein
MTLEPGSYSFVAVSAASPWRLTALGVDPLVVSGRSLGEAHGDGSYAVTLDGGRLDGLAFGAVCLGSGGSPGAGFWANGNGKAMFGEAELALVSELPLRNEDGALFVPTSFDDFRKWYLRSNASNMAFKLSAQLAATELSLHSGHVAADALVFAPGTASANTLGFAVLEDLLVEARSSLEASGLCEKECGDELRPLKDALAAANEDASFVQADLAACPVPVFAP